MIKKLYIDFKTRKYIFSINPFSSEYKLISKELYNGKEFKSMYNHDIAHMLINRYNIGDENVLIKELNNNQNFIKEKILFTIDTLKNIFDKYNYNTHVYYQNFIPYYISENNNDYLIIKDYIKNTYKITNEYINNVINTYLNKNQKDLINETSIDEFIYAAFLNKIFNMESCCMIPLTCNINFCECYNDDLIEIILKLEKEYKNDIKNDIDLYYINIKEGYENYISVKYTFKQKELPDYYPREIELIDQRNDNAKLNNKLNQYLILDKRFNKLTLNLILDKQESFFYLFFEYDKYFKDHQEEMIDKYKKIFSNITGFKSLETSINIINDDNNILNYISYEIF